MLDVEYIKDIVSEVGKEYGIRNAYLFGSYAKGSATEKSDVDLLVDRGEIRDFNTYARFRNTLVDKLGKEVDLITTAGIKDRFFNLIKEDRILLYGA